ncbi:MAG: hypothetical protein ACI9C9_002514 [Marivirga sp.]|jgi:hypothetical protein
MLTKIQLKTMLQMQDNINSLDAKEQVYNQLKQIYSGVLKAG